MTHISHDEFLRLWKLKPMAVADCVIVKNNKILLIKRATTPYKDWWCLPGGLMDVGETIEQTAIREAKEETGITARIISLVGTYSGPKRDPRGTTVSICYLMRPVKITSEHDNEVSDVRFFPFNKLPAKLGFDHKKMISDALKLLRKRKA